MLQDDSLLPFRTILDNCLIGLEVTGKLTEENKQYVIQLLHTYGLGEFLDKLVSPKEKNKFIKEAIEMSEDVFFPRLWKQEEMRQVVEGRKKYNEELRKQEIKKKEKELNIKQNELDTKQNELDTKQNELD